MMKNEATLKFKNFTARPHFFWIRTKLARAGAALCCARLAEVVCLEISSADAKPSGVCENSKIQNFKNRNATSTDYDTDRDINSGRDRAANFKISNANLKADLARPKAGFRR